MIIIIIVLNKQKGVVDILSSVSSTWWFYIKVLLFVQINEFYSLPVRINNSCSTLVCVYQVIQVIPLKMRIKWSSTKTG